MQYDVIGGIDFQSAMAILGYASTFECDELVPTVTENYNASRSSLEVFPASVSIIEIIVFRTVGVYIKIHVCIIGVILFA